MIWLSGISSSKPKFSINFSGSLVDSRRGVLIALTTFVGLLMVLVLATLHGGSSERF